MHKILYLHPHQGGGLLSNNVQDAIEEVNGKIPTVPTNISAFTNDSGYITTDNTRVLKSGDTMTGNLTISKTNTGTTNVSSILKLGNNIPVGTVGTSRGVINFYGKGSNLSQLIAETISADRQVLLPDKSGTMALFEDFNSTSLLANAYYPNAGTWENYSELSDDINNYKYIGFSWLGADQQGYGGVVEKFIDVGNFKKMSVNQPFPLYHDIIDPADTRSILIAYYDATHIRIWRGASIYQYNRLWVTGLIKK